MAMLLNVLLSPKKEGLSVDQGLRVLSEKGDGGETAC